MALRPLARPADIEAGDTASPTSCVTPATAGGPDAEGAILRREGDYWIVTWAGHAVALKDCKGLGYLAHLLRHAGREFHALDLCTQSSAGEPRLPVPGLEILDHTAKAAYRRRVHDLREDLDEAERCNDRGRAELARAELDALTEQLAAAVGLGGRDRRAASATERARSSVTQRVKEAIRKITGHQPALGAHLARYVQTGTFCVYAVDPTEPIHWRFE